METKILIAAWICCVVGVVVIIARCAEERFVGLLLLLLLLLLKPLNTSLSLLPAPANKGCFMGLLKVLAAFGGEWDCWWELC